MLKNSILESRRFIEFFELDKKGETSGLSELATGKWISLRYSEILDSICKWAREKFPDANEIYVRSFASLISHFATGAYGGFGTLNLQKERYAESKAYYFYNNMHNVLSEKEMTDAIIYFTASHILQKAPLERTTVEKIEFAVEKLKETKKSFKSQQIAEARKILEGLLS